MERFSEKARRALLFITLILLPFTVQAQATFNVKTFGAHGDGFTDDTRAVQAAIGAAQAAGSGMVYFPSASGCYMVTGLTFYSNLTYTGESESVCIKSIASSAPLVATPATSPFSNAAISNLTFDGNATSYTGNECLQLRGPTNVAIDNVTTTHCGEDGVYVTGWGSGTNPAGQGNGLLITNLTSSYNARSGMRIVTGKNITVRDSIFAHHNISGPFAGVDVVTDTAAQSAEDLTFENCTFLDNAYHGFNVWESHANRPNLNVRLINSTFQGNGRDGAYLAGSGGYVLSGIYVSGSMSANRANSGYRGGLDIWNASNVVVTNLSVTGASQALFLWGVNGAKVANSALSGSSRDVNTNSSTNVQVYNSTQLAHGTHTGSYATLAGTAPKITTESSLPAAGNTPYSQPLIATGDAGITWNLVGGDLPPGLSLLDVGTIVGTPTSGGLYTFTVDSTNRVTYDEKTFTVAVASVPLAITTASLPNGTANTSYAASLSANGGTPPYGWSASGLPAGLSLNVATGQITGMPAGPGLASLSIQVKDATSATVAKAFTLSVAAPLTISTVSVPNGIAGSSYAVTLSATGGTPPYVWSASGLPAGLNLNSTTGQIAGIPTLAGSTTFTIQVKDATAVIASKTLTVSIGASLAIGTASLPNGTAGSSYSATMSATGGTPPYAWSASGVPAGLNMNSSTGQITGTPSAAGSSTVSVQVKDATSTIATKTFALSIGAAPVPPTISTASFPNGAVGSTYLATLSATGGTPPYSWSASGLPAGLNINSTTGQITGTPSAAGSSTVSIQVKDARAMTATKTLALAIAAAPIALAISTSSLPNGTVSASYSATVSATGGTAPYLWSASGIPAGLSLNSATGQISGTPTAAGSANLAIQVKDVAATIATRTLSLTVAAAPVQPPPSGAVFNVVTYGAKGDGSTNDTAAIQNAINAANSAGGGTVYFPASAGCYRATSLTFYSGLTYAGQTANVCIKSLNAGMGADLIKTPTSSAFSNATITNLLLDGNTTSPASRYDCMSLIAPTNVYISNVKTQYCDEDGFYITGYGTNLATAGDGLLMTNVTADHSGRNGMSIITGKNITVRNSVFQNSNFTAPYDGVDIEPNNSSQTVQNITFENSSFLNNGRSGSTASGHNGFNVWEAFGSLPNLNLRLINCTFSGNLRDGLYAAASGGRLGGVYVIGGTMSNNQALNGYRGGVDIWNTSNVGVSNLSVTSPNQAVFLYGVSGATVANSILSGSSTDLNTNSSTGVQVYSSNTLVHGTHAGSYTTVTGSAPQITTLSLPAATHGVAYSQSFGATGTGSINWATVAATGNSLPAGMTFSAAGVLSGTPSASGTYVFTVQATSGSAFDQRTFTLTVN